MRKSLELGTCYFCGFFICLIMDLAWKYYYGHFGLEAGQNSDLDWKQVNLGIWRLTAS